MTRGIFVVGAGRSGTKFLMNVLNNSPAIHIAPEIHFFSWLIHAGFRKNLRHRAKPAGEEYPLNAIIDCLNSKDNFGTYWRRDVRFRDEEVRRRFGGESATEQNIYRYIIEHDLPEGRDPESYSLVGEKTPSNVFHLDKITRGFPDALVFHIFRNPIDVLQSEVNKESKPDYPLDKKNPFYPYGLALFVFFVWFYGALKALRFRRKYKNLYFISYELMVSDLPGTTRQLASVCGIEYEAGLHTVHRVDSSYNRSSDSGCWRAPGWVRGIYRVCLGPVIKAMDRHAINAGTGS